MTRVFIVAGDPSGDLLASRLIQSMKKFTPDLLVTGVGGNNLQQVCNKFLENIVQQHALGFFISPQKIIFFRKILNKVIQPELVREKYDAVITVDFYGFNSCVAKLAKKLGHKVFYYASPQFWASRPGRADRLRKSVDLFLCLFPFEADFYKQRNLPAIFVGHPILDNLPQISLDAPEARQEKFVGLLPGSRPDEIKRHLPIMIKACALIKKSEPKCRFILFTVPHIEKQLYENFLPKNATENLGIELVEDKDFKWRTQLDLAITASGMETFENALLGIPMVVMYKTSVLNYWIVKSLINISFIGMPNLLSGRQIVPELIQRNATPEKIANHIIHWLKNPAERNELRKELLSLRRQFGESGASDRAARTILEKVA